MNVRSLTATTIDRYLKLVRRPVDLAVARLPGRQTGTAAAVKLTVDRADAAIRSSVGSTLGDEQLTEDARRREAAASERERSVKLRREAGLHEERAEDRLQTRHEQATQRREQAEAKAASQREHAASTEDAKRRRAEEAERAQLAASRKQQERIKERIETESAQARLPAVEKQAQALREREAAIAQTDESERLGEAAARIKRERKRD